VKTRVSISIIVENRDDHYPVSGEISDLCEISGLLLFFSYFAFRKEETKSGNYFLMCLV